MRERNNEASKRCRLKRRIKQVDPDDDHDHDDDDDIGNDDDDIGDHDEKEKKDEKIEMLIVGLPGQDKDSAWESSRGS